jgi:MOSC domain-containing protein
MQKLGRVARLRRYPVKSMKGEELEEAFFEKNGVIGDRLYAFFDERGKAGRQFPWPWITARQVPEMLLYEPRYKSKGTSELEFISNDKEPFVSFVEKKYSLKVRLGFDEKRNHDSEPVSLLGMSTIAQLERESIQLEPERFRANIYAEWEDPEPFFEDGLVGKILSIGSVKIRLLRKNSRCQIPTLDPDTAVPSMKVLENITRNHSGFTGVYASVEKTGVVNRGDEIFS